MTRRDLRTAEREWRSAPNAGAAKRRPAQPKPLINRILALLGL